MLVEGKWTEGFKLSRDGKDGRFVRRESVFRNWVTADGSAGPSGEGGFPAEAGRYHLYVSLNCPWACRTLMVRKLKKLDDVISVECGRAQDVIGGLEIQRLSWRDGRGSMARRISMKSIRARIRIIPAA